MYIPCGSPSKLDAIFFFSLSSSCSSAPPLPFSSYSSSPPPPPPSFFLLLLLLCLPSSSFFFFSSSSPSFPYTLPLPLPSYFSSSSSSSSSSFFLFFFLSLSLLIGWQLSICNCCKPFCSLLYNCQLLCLWRLALSIAVQVFPRHFLHILLLQGCSLQTRYAQLYALYMSGV